MVRKTDRRTFLGAEHIKLAKISFIDNSYEHNKSGKDRLTFDWLSIKVNTMNAGSARPNFSQSSGRIALVR